MRLTGQKRALVAGLAAALPAKVATPDLTGVGQLVDQVVGTQLTRDRIPGAAGVNVAGASRCSPRDTGFKYLIHRTVDRYVPATGPAPRAVAGADTAGLAGDYRVDRTSHTQVTKAVALFSTVTVAVDPDGSLTTSGLSPNPNAGHQHWYSPSSGCRFWR
jgi:hypothetical protein